MSKFIILKPTESTVPEFVEFWKQFYTDPDLAYWANIQQAGTLTTDNIIELMKWKSGPAREIRAEGYGRAVPERIFNTARQEGRLHDASLTALYIQIIGYLKQAGHQRADGIIWPIFLCHVAQPSSVPIYDVNVWRAWGFIEGWLAPNFRSQEPKKFDTYLEYRLWFNELVAQHGLNPRDLDRALMMFGRFLGAPWGDMLG